MGVVCEPGEIDQFNDILASVAGSYNQANTEASDVASDSNAGGDGRNGFGTDADAGASVGDEPSPFDPSDGMDLGDDGAEGEFGDDDEENDEGLVDLGGVYVLNCEGRPLPYLSSFLNNPNLDGFSLRAGWEQVEPSEGNYNWSMFDPVVDYAHQYGKKVMLRVIAGARTPEWVYDAGAFPYVFIDNDPWRSTYGEELTVPIPWDPIYQEKWANLVAVMGQRYADHPAVKIVAITGPGHGGEMHLGDKGNQAAWTAMGYTNAVMTQAWIDATDVYREAFPHQHLSIGIAHPVAFGQPAQVVAGVAAYAADVGVGLQGNWLSAKLNPQFDLYQFVAAHSQFTPVGFQELCSAQRPAFGGSMGRAMELAYAANSCYIEFYAGDIDAYPDDIAAAHEWLCSMQP